MSLTVGEYRPTDETTANDKETWDLMVLLIDTSPQIGN